MCSAKEIYRSQPVQGDDSGCRVWMVGWNHNGSLLSSCGEDKTVRLWKFHDGTLECSSELDDSHARTVRCVAFSHCGNLIASASFDASIVVYQKDQGSFTESNKLEGHESEVKWCAFSPSDEFLATCSRDKSVWFWQLDEDDDFQVSSILQPHTQDVKCVVWHPTENRFSKSSNSDALLFGVIENGPGCSSSQYNKCYDSNMRFFKYDGDDWITQQKIDKAHEGTVWSAVFDAEGNRLCTVGEDQIVQIWTRKDLSISAQNDTWQSVCKYKIDDCRWPLYSVSWSCVSGLVAVGCGDNTIRILRFDSTPSNENIVSLETIRQHEGDVNCVSWHPVDASVLASCSDDGSIRLFRIQI